MAATLAQDIASAIYRVTLPMRDFQSEQLRKQFRISNNGGNLDVLLQHFDNITQARFVDPSASIDAGLTGMKTVAGTGTVSSKIANFINLSFSKVHPLDGTKTVYTTFLIPAYRQEIFDEATKTIIYDPAGLVGTTTVTPGTTLDMQFGALINYLAATLIYHAADNVDYVGGWTFQPGLVTAGTLAKVVDSSPYT